MKQKIYNISYHYLVDIKKGIDDPEGGYNKPGTSIIDYIQSRKEYRDQPEIINMLLNEFSSFPEILPVKSELKASFEPK